jgi:hypothetical protein
MRRELEHLDRELDVHIALDPAAPGRVGEFLGGLGNDPVAVIVEPVDQRADRGIFLALDQRGEIECSDQVAAPLEFLEQATIVHVETKLLRRSIEVGAIDKERDARFGGHGQYSCSKNALNDKFKKDGGLSVSNNCLISSSATISAWRLAAPAGN